MSEPIGLTELIEKVKQDLLADSGNADTNGPIFFVDGVELELKVTATKEAGAGLKVNVLPWTPVKAEADAKAGVRYENAHTVKVKLSPLYSKEQILAWRELKHPDQVPKALDALSDAVVKGPDANKDLKAYE